MQFPNVGKCGMCTCTRVRVLFEYLYSYSSTKESNRTRTRVHYQSNRTHDYFSRLHFFHMNSCKQIIFACLIYYIRQIKMAILEVI